MRLVVFVHKMLDIGYCIACIGRYSPRVFLVAVDDFIEALYARRNELELAYDFTLNMGGGSIKGYKIKNCKPVIDAIHNLLVGRKLVACYDAPFAFVNSLAFLITETLLKFMRQSCYRFMR